MELEFVKFIDTYGIPLALVIFFVWRDWKREELMSKRIQALECEMRNTLKNLVVETTKVISENTSAIKELMTWVTIIPCIPCELKDKLIKKGA